MPQILNHEAGTPKRITTSGLTCISPKNCNLLGIYVAGIVTTAPLVNVYSSATAGGPLIIGTSTLALNAFARIPSYCAGGLTFAATNDNVDVTIFWNPAAST